MILISRFEVFMLVKIELFSALLHCVVDHVGSIFGVEVVSNHHAMQFNNPENHEFDIHFICEMHS
jgi:hypothetical protein